jgi:hypothetical protein
MQARDGNLDIFFQFAAIVLPMAAQRQGKKSISIFLIYMSSPNSLICKLHQLQSVSIEKILFENDFPNPNAISNNK